MSISFNSTESLLQFPDVFKATELKAKAYKASYNTSQQLTKNTHVERIMKLAMGKKVCQLPTSNRITEVT